MKALPYGISDFPRIMRKNYYYVDKSRYIEMIERQPSYLFLIRPRRFGKSLFLAMLETYYSIDYADSFEEIFGELYIGKHPTPDRNGRAQQVHGFAIQLLCNQFEVGGCGAFVLRVLLHGDEEFHPEIRAPVGQ